MRQAALLLLLAAMLNIGTIPPLAKPRCRSRMSTYRFKQPRMHQDKLYQHWHRQYGQLLKRQDLLLQQARAHGLPKHIHDLRVTLRKLRLMVRVSALLLDRQAAERYRRWSRKITNATSHLRDFDVALEWLLTQDVHPALANTLQAQRQRLWKMSRRRLLPPPPKVWSALQRLESTKRGRQRLNRRYPSRFARLHARVVTQIPRCFELDDAGRHALRRNIRRLRYLRELTLTDRQRKHDQLLKALIRPQAAMGEYQNVILARRIISSVHSPALPPNLRRALTREETRWQRQIKTSLRDLARVYRSYIRAGTLGST